MPPPTTAMCRLTPDRALSVHRAGRGAASFMIVVAEVSYLLIIHPDHGMCQPLAQVTAKLSSV